MIDLRDVAWKCSLSSLKIVINYVMLTAVVESSRAVGKLHHLTISKCYLQCNQSWPTAFLQYDMNENC